MKRSSLGVEYEASLLLPIGPLQTEKSYAHGTDDTQPFGGCHRFDKIHDFVLWFHISLPQSNSMFIELDFNEIQPFVKVGFGNQIQASVKSEAVLHPMMQRMNQV